MYEPSAIISAIIMFVICMAAVAEAFGYFSTKIDKNNNDKSSKTTSSSDSNYAKPVFKELTAEQIADIHSRGKITPAEMVEEWEEFDLCAPGDGIGSAGWRCKKFKCCHDCLVDYANERDEYTSIFDIMEKNKYVDVDESELMIDMNKILE